MATVLSLGRCVLAGRPAVALFFALLICATPGLAEESGGVRGQVVDTELAALPNAAIRVMPRTTGSTKYRSQGRSDGSFYLDGIEPGTYVVAVSVHGFREKLIDNVLVNTGSEVDLGSVRLVFAGCDAPGVNCDSFSAEPATEPTFSHGEIKVPLECTADIDHGGVLCTVVLDGPASTSPMSDHTSDFWLHLRSDKHVYLEPRNGARLAEPNSTEADCRGAVFLDRRIRIDGLGPGSDLCLRSNEGRISHIFFTGEVQPDSKQIAIYYVTRK